MKNRFLSCSTHLAVDGGVVKSRISLSGTWIRHGAACPTDGLKASVSETLTSRTVFQVTGGGIQVSGLMHICLGWELGFRIVSGGILKGPWGENLTMVYKFCMTRASLSVSFPRVCFEKHSRDRLHGYEGGRGMSLISNKKT